MATTTKTTTYKISDLQADLTELLKNGESLSTQTPVAGFDTPWLSTIDIQRELNDLAQWVSHARSDHQCV